MRMDVMEHKFVDTEHSPNANTTHSTSNHHIHPTPTHLTTNIQNRNRRIMIRRLRIILHPRIQMQMLHPRLRLRQTLTHIHMIQLLTVHVIQIRVALCGRRIYDTIEVVEVVGSEGLEGLDEGEVVEVAGDEDFGG